MHAAQTAETIARHAHALKIRHLNPARVANHDVFDIALAIDEHTDLPANFVRQFAKLPRKFVCYDLMRRNAALVELFDPPKLVWFQTLGVPVKASHAVDWRNYIMGWVLHPTG